MTLMIGFHHFFRNVKKNVGQDSVSGIVLRIHRYVVNYGKVTTYFFVISDYIDLFVLYRQI
jgi:hypothetical protein